jgi:hypothetical protein
MKFLFAISLFLFSFSGDKLDPQDKVFIRFEKTAGQPNTEEAYAKSILTEYIKNKSSLILVETEEDADFAFVLRMYEKGKTNMGKIDILKTSD